MCNSSIFCCVRCPPQAELAPGYGHGKNKKIQLLWQESTSESSTEAGVRVRVVGFFRLFKPLSFVFVSI